MNSTVLRMLACSWLALLVSCKGSGDDKGGDAKIRLLNLSTGYPTLDLITNVEADDDDDDDTQSEAVALEAVGDYQELESDTYAIKLKRTGSGSILRSFTNEELVEDDSFTYVAYGEVGAFGALRIDDTLEEADAGEARLSI